MGSSSTEMIHRSTCPIASALDLIGDRWTLLIFRDLLLGKTKYNELLASDEGIPTNILADCLLRLQRFGLLEKKAYQNIPPRFAYSLTEKSRGLSPVLAAVAMWGKR